MPNSASEPEQLTSRISNADLFALQKLHTATAGGFCSECGHPYPCDVHRLVADVWRLTNLLSHSEWVHIPQYGAHPDPEDGEPCPDCVEIEGRVGKQIDAARAARNSGRVVSLEEFNRTVNAV